MKQPGVSWVSMALWFETIKILQGSEYEEVQMNFLNIKALQIVQFCFMCHQTKSCEFPNGWLLLYAHLKWWSWFDLNASGFISWYCFRILNKKHWRNNTVCSIMLRDTRQSHHMRRFSLPSHCRRSVLKGSTSNSQNYWQYVFKEVINTLVNKHIL